MSLYDSVRPLYDDPDAYAEKVTGKIFVKDYRFDDDVSITRLETLALVFRRVLYWSSHPKIDYDKGEATGRFSPRDWENVQYALGLRKTKPCGMHDVDPSSFVANLISIPVVDENGVSPYRAVCTQ